MRRVLFVFLALALAPACTGASQQQLVKRASFDLGCPEAQLDVVEIDQRTRGVKGCGKRATYVETCDNLGQGAHNCTWIMNTDATRANPQNEGLPEQTIEP